MRSKGVRHATDATGSNLVSLATVIEAVVDALAHLGVNPVDMPSIGCMSAAQRQGFHCNAGHDDTRHGASAEQYFHLFTDRIELLVGAAIVDETEGVRRLAVLMRRLAEQIQDTRLGYSTAVIGRGMVTVGLELWLQAVGPQQLAFYLNDQARQYEAAAKVEALIPPEPPSAH